MKPVYVEGTTILKVGSSAIWFDNRRMEDMLYNALQPEENEEFEGIPAEVYIEIVPMRMGLKITNSCGDEEEEQGA